MLQVTAGLDAALADIVGAGHVVGGDGYERDWTGRFGGPARLVVRPGDTAEVAAVLRACAEHGAPVVPQGGNTGLVGGGVPRGGEVLLSLRRLDALGAIDPGAMQVEAGAGVTLAALQAHARRSGLDAAVDFAARDACTVRGLVATDAGGMRALLVGSEGTLGVITSVRWRLVPLLPARVAALVPLGSLAEAAALLAALRPALPSLEAADFFLDDGLELVLAHLGIASPVRRAPAYVVLECAAAADPTPELAA